MFQLHNEANYTNATQKDIVNAMIVLENVAHGETTLDMQTADILCGFINSEKSLIEDLKDKLSRRNMQIKDLKKEVQELRCYIGSTKKNDLDLNRKNIENINNILNR